MGKRKFVDDEDDELFEDRCEGLISIQCLLDEKWYIVGQIMLSLYSFYFGKFLLKEGKKGGREKRVMGRGFVFFIWVMVK